MSDISLSLDGASDAVIHVDNEGDCTYANRAAERLFGAIDVERPLRNVLPRSLLTVLESCLHRAGDEGRSVALPVLDPAAEKWYNCRVVPGEDGLTIFLREASTNGSDLTTAADDALRLSQEQFRALADVTPQIVWTISPTGAILYLNQKGYEYFGLEPREQPYGWSSMVHPDDLHNLHDRWRAALESNTMFESELRLRGRDGVFRWHLARALPVRNDAGRVTHWCGTSTDVHDMKLAQVRLEEREQMFRTMADTAPVMIWVADERAAVTYLNAGWLEFTGRAVDQEIGDGWLEGVAREDRDRVRSAYAAAVEEQSEFRIEFRLRRRDGRFRWVLNHGAPLFDDSDTLTGYIGSCIDIHERKQIEDQSRFLAEVSPLLTSSLEYEPTLEAVANLMVPRLADFCAVDILGPDGKVHLVTVAHKDPEKVRLGYDLRERFPPDMTADAGLARVIRTGRAELYPEITSEILRQIARSPAHLEALESVGFRSALVVPLVARDETLGTLTLVWSDSDRRYGQEDLEFTEEVARRVAVVIDNARLYHQARAARQALETMNETLEARVEERTQELQQANEELRNEVEERRRAQRALARANLLLEHRNRELEDFAHVASHDLQEPLRKIMSFATLLEQDFGDRLEGASVYIDRIVSSADRMTGLMRDLVAFSRVSTQGESHTKVDLNAVLADVLLDMDGVLGECGGRVEAEELECIEADPLQMRQLFQNLIGNALKFRRDAEPPVIRIRGKAENGVYVVELADNGIGFDEKYVDRIFAPFQRLHGRGAYPGTGMGLAICRRIVERHDGTITARSRPGAGTTFELRLPLRHTSESAAAD